MGNVPATEAPVEDVEARADPAAPLIPENPRGSKDDDALFEKYSQKIAFIIYWVFTNMGSSGFMGVCCGYAFKILARWVALLIGIGFIIIQILGYYGVVTVHWGALKRQVMLRLDQDGDGDVDFDDFKIMVKKGMSLLGQGLPSIGGFVLGVWWGLQWF